MLRFPSRSETWNGEGHAEELESDLDGHQICFRGDILPSYSAIKRAFTARHHEVGISIVVQ